MRVLLLTQWFEPEPFFKGLTLAKALIARGFDVEVLTGFPNYPGGKVYPGYRIRIWQREVIDGVSVLRVPLYPSHDASPLGRSANYLSFAATSSTGAILGVRRPDVVWVYNLVTLAPAALMLRALYGCPVVLDLQDLWPDSVMSSGMLKGWVWQRMLAAMSDRGYRSMDMIVAQSPGMKRKLVERGIAPERVQVCYNWTEESGAVRHQPDQGLATDLRLGDTFNVIFAGTMGLVQRLDVVLDAAKILQDSAPRARLILVGGGVDCVRLVQRARTLQLTNVTFLPRQPRHEMGRLMSVSHLGLVHLQNDPLFRITIPSKIQAYLREGLPILVAVDGDAKEVVERARAGVGCRSEDAKALADAIAELSRVPTEELRQMGIRGREFYDREMSCQAGVGRLELYLRQVVAEHSAKQGRSA